MGISLYDDNDDDMIALVSDPKYTNVAEIHNEMMAASATIV